MTLKAGLKLDALVAEKVMGWRDVKNESDNDVRNESGNYDYPWVGGISPDGVFAEVPNFSTDLAAAWTVVEKAQSWYTGTIMRDGVIDTDERWAAFVRARPKYPHHMKASALAEAICLAALQAVGEDVSSDD